MTQSIADKIKERLARGDLPYDIRKSLKVSRALVELHAATFPQGMLKAAREAKKENYIKQKYTLGIVNEEEGTQKCHRCDQWLPFDDFSLHSGRYTGRSAACRPCTSLYTKDYYNREDVIARKKEQYDKWRAANPPKPKPVLTQEERKVRQLLTGAKVRAKRKGLPWDDVAYTDLVLPEYCPVIPYIKLTYDGSDRWSAASLDRIIPELGYVKGNIQVMSMRANLMKNNSNDNERQAFASWALSMSNGG